MSLLAIIEGHHTEILGRNLSLSLSAIVDGYHIEIQGRKLVLVSHGRRTSYRDTGM